MQDISSYVIKSIPVAGVDETVGGFRRRMASTHYDDASHLFVVESGNLLMGVAPISHLFSARDNQMTRELVAGFRWPSLELESDREDAASQAIQCGVASLPVLTSQGRLIGAVGATELLKILRDEHIEDLHHMAGILAQSDKARAALTGSPLRRALYRVPWLLAGMAGSVVATAVMASSEDDLAKHILVTLFIPALIYLADAVGTQSEAVAVRSFSLMQASILNFLWGEILTGFLIGSILGSIALPAIWLVFGDIGVALAVTLSLVSATGIAALAGLLLPWLFDKLGFDPALASGPLATVVQDVTTLAIYLTFARLMVF